LHHLLVVEANVQPFLLLLLFGLALLLVLQFGLLLEELLSLFSLLHLSEVFFLSLLLQLGVTFLR